MANMIHSSVNFLKLHAQKNNALILVCLEHITTVTPIAENFEAWTRIYTVDGDYTDVKEDMRTIIDIMRGCAI